MSDSVLQAQFAAISAQRSATYANIAAFTTLAYDVLLDLSREYKYIWSAGWSLPKALYIFTRYYGLIHVGMNTIMGMQVGLSVHACNAWLHLTTVAGPVVFTTVINVILLLRLYALYESSTRVLWSMIIVVSVEFVLELYTTVETLFSENPIPSSPSFPYPGCLSQSRPHISELVAWIPALCISVVFFGMTIRKFVSTAKNRRGRLHPRHGKNEKISPLFMALVRDGTVFFLLIAVILLISTLSGVILKGPLGNVSLMWLTAVYSYSATRLIINLREAALNIHQESTWNETMQLSALEFMGERSPSADTSNS